MNWILRMIPSQNSRGDRKIQKNFQDHPLQYKLKLYIYVLSKYWWFKLILDHRGEEVSGMMALYITFVSFIISNTSSKHAIRPLESNSTPTPSLFRTTLFLRLPCSAFLIALIANFFSRLKPLNLVGQWWSKPLYSFAISHFFIIFFILFALHV